MARRFNPGGPPRRDTGWLASALGNKACRDNRSVLHQRVPVLFEDLALAVSDGCYARFGRADLLIHDDLGLQPLDAAARFYLLEILENRHVQCSIVTTSQLSVERLHAINSDPTYADAIMSRLVHNAHSIEISGESLRQTRTQQTITA